MHEYSMLESLLSKVAEEVSGMEGAKVTKLHVSVGELSGLDAALFATAYDTFREASGLGDAVLCIRDVPARWACPVCAEPIAPGTPLRCGCCQVPAKLMSGDEVILERIELEVERV